MAYPHHEEAQRWGGCEETQTHLRYTVLHTLTQLVSSGQQALQVGVLTGTISHPAQRAKAHLIAYTTSIQRVGFCTPIFTPIPSDPGPTPPLTQSHYLEAHSHPLCTHSRQLCIHSHPNSTGRVSQPRLRPQLHTPRPTFHHHTGGVPATATEGLYSPCSGAHPLPTANLPAPRAAPGPAAKRSGPSGRDWAARAAGAPWPAAFAARPLPPPRSLARSLPIWEGGCGAGGGGRGRGGAGRVTCERRAGGRWKGERHGARNKRVGVGKSRPSRRGSGRSVRAPAAPRLRAPAPDPGAAPVRPLAPAAGVRPGPPVWPRVRAMRR